MSHSLRWFISGVAFALIIQPVLPASAQSAPATGAPTIFRRTLPSGVRLIVAERPGADLTALEVRVRVGSASETPENNGIAHFIEHVLCKGTATRPRGAIDQSLEELGGELDARTSRDWTRYGVTVPAGDTPWRGALNILADMIQHAAFRPDDVEAERAVIRGEVAAYRSEPPRLGNGELYAAVYGKQPRGERFPIMGSDAGIAHLQGEDLRGFWRAWYRPANMTLVVVGNVHADAVVAEASHLFSVSASASPGATPSPITVYQPLEGVMRAPSPSLQSERGLVNVLVGFQGPGLAEPDDMPACEVLTTLLADGGARGRVADALILQSHRALSVSSDYLPGRTDGLFFLSAVGLARDAHSIEGALLREVEKLRGEDPLLDSEIQEARDRARNSVRYENATVTGMAKRLGMLDALDAPPLLADDYAARIDAVTPEQVRRVAARYLTSGRCAIVWIGPPTPAADDTVISP